MIEREAQRLVIKVPMVMANARGLLEAGRSALQPGEQVFDLAQVENAGEGRVLADPEGGTTTFVVEIRNASLTPVVLSAPEADASSQLTVTFRPVADPVQDPTAVPGDRSIKVPSDGVVEATSPKGEAFGDGRLALSLASPRSDDLIAHLRAALAAHLAQRDGWTPQPWVSSPARSTPGWYVADIPAREQWIKAQTPPAFAARGVWIAENSLDRA